MVSKPYVIIGVITLLFFGCSNDEQKTNRRGPNSGHLLLPDQGNPDSQGGSASVDKAEVEDSNESERSTPSKEDKEDVEKPTSASSSENGKSDDCQDDGIWGGGSGSLFDPFLICNKTQLKQLSQEIWVGLPESTTFALGRDIDMAGEDFKPIKEFGYILLGREHVIRNLTLDTTTVAEGQDVGFISWLRPTGIVKDVTLENLVVKTEKLNNVGGVVGLNEGEIHNVKIRGGEIHGFIAGGLVGINTGLVTSSLAHADVFLETKVEKQCEEAGQLGAVGGLVGLNASDNPLQRALIEHSSSNGHIEANFCFGGGLVGINRNHADIRLSSVTGGWVKSANWAGGLVGRLDGGKIENSYVLDDTMRSAPASAKPDAKIVVEATYQGALLGEYVKGDLRNLFAIVELKRLAEAQNTLEDKDKQKDYKGLIGWESSLINQERLMEQQFRNSVFYQSQLVDRPTPASRSIEDMSNIRTYQTAFGDDWDRVWRQVEGENFPQLQPPKKRPGLELR